MWQAIIDALKATASWFFGLFSSFAEYFFDIVLGFIPEDAAPSIELIEPYLILANYYLPLDFSWTLFVAWFFIYTFMTILRFIKQFVPSLSN